MDDHTEEYDLPAAEEFAKEYCGPRTNLETQARDAAWVLYEELQKLRKIHSRCKPVKDGEDPKPADEEEANTQEDAVAASEESSSEDFATADSTAPADAPKIKRPKIKSSSKSYVQFIREQVKVIGMAGTIAMSTAVYSQSQAVATNGAIVYKVIEKEVPLLGYIRGVVTGQIPFSAMEMLRNAASSVSSVSSNAAANGLAAKAVAAAESAVAKGDGAAAGGETAATETGASEKADTAAAARATPAAETIAEAAAKAAVDPSSPEARSIMEAGVAAAQKQDGSMLVAPPENPVPPVINPPHVTDPNPPAR
jgi:hypothetical protein